MIRPKIVRLHALAAGMFSLWSCEVPAGPPSSGGLAIDVVVSPGSGAALDAGRVHVVGGSTNRVVAATPGQDVTIDQLPPGSYTVALEGLIANEVDRYGDTTGVQIVAGPPKRITISFLSFVPALTSLPPSTASKLLTVTYGNVSRATSYQVEWATDLPFTTGQDSVTTTQTSVPVTVLNFGAYYVRVRAFDPYQARGRPSAAQSILVADLAGISADLNDLFQQALVANLTSGVQSRVQAALVQCADGVAQANFAKLASCVSSTRAEVAAATDGNDKALLATLALFLDDIGRRFNG